jgi:predicted DNA-binding transcriptional regulator YafY
VPRERRGAARRVHETARVAQVVTAIRSGDRAATSRPLTPAASLSPSGALAVLREAVESGTPVLIGYVDNHGASSERIVDPLSVEGGQLVAHDHRSDDVRSFAVHRITTVRPVGA